ncbi:Trp operon leader peptide [Vibrio sp. AK197]|uniref:Trp operon leader peptide n=1 Tax=Vibrio olivae TaxID=1243002 RepID=A0ABV5HI49_9VIBR
MLQEFNHNQKAKPLNSSSELNWWRTWTQSWWATVYF